MADYNYRHPATYPIHCDADYPVCTCDEDCCNPYSELSVTHARDSANAPVGPPRRSGQHDSSDANSTIEQDNTRGFFRFPAEVRAKIYFLALRPDCWFSIGHDVPCDHKHVHQDRTGRAESWKILALCRRIWSEADQYRLRPFRLIQVTGFLGECIRCKGSKQKKREIREEGFVHGKVAGLTARWGEKIPELWLARSTNVEVFFGHVRKNFSVGRFASHRMDPNIDACYVHSLESVVALVEKLNFLNNIVLMYYARIPFVAPLIPGMENAIVTLFRILKKRQLQDEDFEIEITVREDDDDYDFGQSNNAMRAYARQAGWTDGEINDFCEHDQEFSPASSRQSSNTNSTSTSESKSRRASDDSEASVVDVSGQRKLRFDVRVFDGDLKTRNPTDDGDDLDMTGIAQGLNGLEKYKKSGRWLDLYLEEHFDLPDEYLPEYTMIPECKCGKIFAQAYMLDRHQPICAMRNKKRQHDDGDFDDSSSEPRHKKPRYQQDSDSD